VGRSKTVTRLAILLVIFLGIGIALYNAFVKDKTVVKVGEPAPNFILSTLQGNHVELSQLRGKGVLLNFWGTWCPPCREEMPSIEKAYQKYKDQGLAVVAVNIGESEVPVTSFKNQYKITFPIAMDRKKEITQLYAIDPIPTTYFIDKNGLVKKIVIGGPMSEQNIADNIKQILP
jgi:peroxiredoxin